MGFMCLLTFESPMRENTWLWKAIFQGIKTKRKENAGSSGWGGSTFYKDDRCDVGDYVDTKMYRLWQEQPGFQKTYCNIYCPTIPFLFLVFFHFFFILYSCFILFCISPFQKRVILSINHKRWYVVLNRLSSKKLSLHRHKRRTKSPTAVATSNRSCAE